MLREDRLLEARRKDLLAGTNGTYWTIGTGKLRDTTVTFYAENADLSGADNR